MKKIILGVLLISIACWSISEIETIPITLQLAKGSLFSLGLFFPALLALVYGIYLLLYVLFSSERRRKLDKVFSKMSSELSSMDPCISRQSKKELQDVLEEIENHYNYIKSLRWPWESRRSNNQ